MKFLIATLLLVFSIPVFSDESICEKIESKGEGHWPIPDTAFTIERAKEALKELNDFIDGVDFERDPPGAEHMLERQNDWIMIKGYLYRLILKYEKDERFKQDFCDFVKHDAFFHH